MKKNIAKLGIFGIILSIFFALHSFALDGNVSIMEYEEGIEYEYGEEGSEE